MSINSARHLITDLFNDGIITYREFVRLAAKLQRLSEANPKAKVKLNTIPLV